MIKIILAVVALGAASIFYTDQEVVQSPEKEQVILQSVMLAMSQAHLQPIEINDDFSAKIFDEFLEVVDGRKRFLVKEDIAQLESYRYELDDNLKVLDLSFLDKVMEIIDGKIAKTKSFYTEILAEPFDFSNSELIEIDFEKLDFEEDEAALRARWEERLKYYTLQELEEKVKAQKTVKDEEPKSEEELEKEAREEIATAYEKWYENYEKLRRSDRFEQFLNVITRQYDPHSAYFSPKGKQDFNMRMGGKLEGIGAQLLTVGELTQVVSIVPGGPVWKDERLEVNDFILKVAQDGEQAVDITGMRIDDVVTLIRGPKGTNVTLTIQKKDESQVDIEIERDVINLEIARARAAMLETEDSDINYGYIDLPMFYNSFDGPEGNSSAKDVASFIDSLKSEGMDGLILDLRDNLGGALVDAIDISGLFIEQGPVVQVKSKDRRPYIHKDDNSSVIYDGPLIVLVNNFSASASEIVAGALQDYGRAVIVGSQTFGKGSVQNFIDLDRAIRGNADVKPLGEIKLTIQKYYRVNGESTQLRGVLPDITLPDSYDFLPTGERENESALAWSRIQEVEYGQDVLTYDNKEELKEKSAMRIQGSEEFAAITEYATWLKDNKDNTMYPLDLNKYMERVDELKAKADQYGEIFDKPIPGLKIRPVKMDFESEITQEAKDARAEAWQEGVSQDIYISEATSIVDDIVKSASYANLQKKIKE